MSLTYKIEPSGKKFATVCRTDGFWSITFTSKNTRIAKRKGDEFVSGERTAFRKYTTAYGRALNEEKSRKPKRVGIIAHTPHGGSGAALAMAVAMAFPGMVSVDVLDKSKESSNE